ncbi:MAG: phosphatase PAP2 family protein [Solirubrobacteraceae bacterium]
MVRSLRSLEGRFLPRGGADAVRQVLLFAAAYMGYRIVRGMIEGQIGAASWNATQLIWVEHRLHVFVEPAVQAWATSTHWVIVVASFLYVNTHFAITFGSLLWLYSQRNKSFYFVRNMFMIAMGIALVVYLVYPTAPPRLMPEWGFSDSVATFTGLDEQAGAVGALVNSYAAVPSMHVCFALIIGWPIVRLVRSPVLKVMWALYPFLVTFVVVATGNHYVLDALFGALTAALAALTAHRLLARARPGAWAFSPAPAGAVEAPA